MYTRNCPQCGKELSYKGKSGLNRAIRNNSVCQTCNKKGKTRSEEARRNISEAKKGEKHPNYGKTFSEESRRKLSERQIGEKNHLYGKTHSEESRRKISIGNGGIGELDQKWSHIPTWAKRVKERDNRRCVYCGSNKKLHAHHILAKSKHPEWALFVNNGITLCNKCHIEEHKLNGCL